MDTITSQLIAQWESATQRRATLEKELIAAKAVEVDAINKLGARISPDDLGRYEKIGIWVLGTMLQVTLLHEEAQPAYAIEWRAGKREYPTKPE